MSFGLLASPGWGDVLLTVCPSSQSGGMSPGTKYVLTVLAYRLPAVGSLVYENEQEFLDELSARTGIEEKKVRGFIQASAELGWFERRKVVGEGHVELRPTVPLSVGRQFNTRRAEKGEAPRVVYAVSDMSVDAVRAALKEADEAEKAEAEARAPGPDVAGSGQTRANARGRAGGGANQPRLLDTEEPGKHRGHGA